jgi:hypothetical protein
MGPQLLEFGAVGAQEDTDGHVSWGVLGVSITPFRSHYNDGRMLGGYLGNYLYLSI